MSGIHFLLTEQTRRQTASAHCRSEVVGGLV